jgi:hypothetical protein
MLADVDHQLESLFEKYDEMRSRDVLAQIRGLLNRRKYILNLVDEVHKTLSATTHLPQPTA